jgi:dissimilatory sulfite reductase alpha subunit
MRELTYVVQLFLFVPPEGKRCGEYAGLILTGDQPMAKKLHQTPLLDQLESGPWPSFVTGLKRLAKDHDNMVDLLGHLEHCYTTRRGWWKGGTVGVYGYGGGVIPRFTEIKDEEGKPRFPDAAEMHLLRLMPAPGMHYTTKALREICDIWERHGSGLVCMHGQSGDFQLTGIDSAKLQGAFDEINEAGWDMGGAGPGVRSAASCVGSARCEHSCYDEGRAHRQLFNEFLDEMHRPALPYKFKFKFSGCPNDCTNSIQRSDMALIGTWRDHIRTDDEMGRKWFAQFGMDDLVNNVVSRCPTKAMRLVSNGAPSKSKTISIVALNDKQSLEIENRDCVRCMHCINVMPGALAPGKDKGAAVLVGGKRTLKVGDLLGSVVVPFLPLQSDADYEALVELAKKILDFYAENALEHERCGEMITRIGLANFLEGLGLEADPNMVNNPRTSPYVKTDGWNEEVARIKAKKASA